MPLVCTTVIVLAGLLDRSGVKRRLVACASGATTPADLQGQPLSGRAPFGRPSTACLRQSLRTTDLRRSSVTMQRHGSLLAPCTRPKSAPSRWCKLMASCSKVCSTYVDAGWCRNRFSVTETDSRQRRSRSQPVQRPVDPGQSLVPCGGIRTDIDIGHFITRLRAQHHQQRLDIVAVFSFRD